MCQNLNHYSRTRAFVYTYTRAFTHNVIYLYGVYLCACVCACC